MMLFLCYFLFLCCFCEYLFKLKVVLFSVLSSHMVFLAGLCYEVVVYLAFIYRWVYFRIDAVLFRKMVRSEIEIPKMLKVRCILGS